MAHIEGGCLCGKVRYTISAEPVATALCHCKHCQKHTGSAFAALLAVPSNALNIDKSSLKFYGDKGDSGHYVKRGFCPECGSGVMSEVEVTPGLEWLRAGSLDDSSWYKPGINIWCASAQHWVTMPEGVPSVPGNPPAG